MSDSLLERLRRIDPAQRAGFSDEARGGAWLDEWRSSGVKFAAGSERFENVYYDAWRKLDECIRPTGGDEPVLREGGAYPGCWLESTGTINAELLSRFVPGVTASTFRLFSDFLKEDGQMPYKITADGPAYRQIQMVTPLARSVWRHYSLNGRDRDFLRRMYAAMARYDGWLERYRNTRGTGCVEAFCTFDTGHDLSPRFWHVPDSCHMDDARRYDPASPILPFLAPDLTANVYCQRKYLALMAEELGESGAADWRGKAEASLDSLMRHCYDERDGFFYDRDANGQLVRVQSDVLLRVLACEVGDLGFFDGALRRYLLNTRKFFAKYPFTSVAMDDPRFDPSSAYNSWAGTTNFLTLIRAPHAFEFHGRYVELTWVLYPILCAMARMTRFPQTLSPWTGAEGYTDTYSPSILCLLDFVERLCGILPTPEGELWFTGLLPYPMDHGEEIASETAYARTVDGVGFELVNTRSGSTVYRGGEAWIQMPFGLRAVTDRVGRLQAVIGMSAATAEGTVRYEGAELHVRVKGNQRLRFENGRFAEEADPGIVPPTYA
ncbi:MGH1-like glycoside hydrolase domain-containing protein [Cohnella caldifontis]|uniref:MGH1-like glycoside hydrolase domain-containing protein n=1 Tax=Cohnella caldifontis TaxID=3027471 RepID=UPI0023ED0BCF|nr:hypothetical protein [Cohnella sp. YIM B05605]